MKFTAEQFASHMAKVGKRLQAASDSVESEAELQRDIATYCRQRGWIADRGSMAHRTFRQIGEPDFCIWADHGRVFSIECKARLGKLTTEQLARQMMMERLGHKVHVVRSMREFLEIIK